MATEVIRTRKEILTDIRSDAEVLGGSVIVRDRKRGEVQCFRPDLESAQKAAEHLEAKGTLPVKPSLEH